LPTSLTYFLPSTRGSSPWRPAAVISTAPRKRPSPGFSRSTSGLRTRPNAMLFRPPRRFPSQAVSAAIGRYQEKKSLPSAPAGVSRLPCVAAPLRRVLESHPDSLSRPVPSTLLAITLPLRTDSPGSNSCSPGTFPHFSLQSPPLNICYSHQDLHQGPFHAPSPPRCHTTPAPSYSSAPPPCADGRVSVERLAPSIFRATPFGRRVVTHSLADADFHGHRPAV